MHFNLFCRFLAYDDINDYKKKKHKKPTLSAKELKLHGQIVFKIFAKPFTNQWNIKDELRLFALCLDSYAEYLDTANQKQQSRQLMMHPVRQVDVDVSVQHVEKTNAVSNTYAKLDLALSEMSFFEPLYFDETTLASENMNSSQRYKFLNNLALSVDVHILHYDPGAGLGALTFFWKVQDNISSKDMYMIDNQVIHSMRPKLPQYHTRKMRLEFYSIYERISGINIPPHVLRSIYSMLTGDASADQNPGIDQRMRTAVLASDPDLIIDLRHLNKGRPADTFEVFFDTLDHELEELKAADERRHGVEHISRFLSVRDLISQVKAKLPENVPIPSESTVLLAFVPKKAHANVSKLYKGRVPMKMKVQTRQLRASHQDEHYCASLFKMLREYAVKFREQISFVCMDDKSKIDFGEPGVHISSGVRGRKSIVPVESALSCLDHDVSSKGSLTPSVVLLVDIPEDVSETFYRGQVALTMKDSIFQPSTPFRHAIELKNILDVSEKKPVLFLYTDGGPDHRTTYNSVKLSLIVLFKQLKLEFLVACRTAPGHSWANPAERIMSLLNICFQNTALSREESTSEIEQIIKSCNGMSEIRRKSEKVDGLKDKWIESLKPMMNMLEDRAKRVQLKGKPFNVFQAADDIDVEQTEARVTLIDPTINVGKYQQTHMTKARGFKEYIGKYKALNLILKIISLVTVRYKLLKILRFIK